MSVSSISGLAAYKPGLNISLESSTGKGSDTTASDKASATKQTAPPAFLKSHLTIKSLESALVLLGDNKAALSGSTQEATSIYSKNQSLKNSSSKASTAQSDGATTENTNVASQQSGPASAGSAPAPGSSWFVGKVNTAFGGDLSHDYLEFDVQISYGASKTYYNIFPYTPPKGATYDQVAASIKQLVPSAEDATTNILQNINQDGSISQEDAVKYGNLVSNTVIDYYANHTPGYDPDTLRKALAASDQGTGA